MEHKYAVGNYICQLRTGKGYTQKELGALLGVTDKAVSEWENGAALPRRELLRRLAAVLGCSQEDALYVGDSEVDIATASNSGLPCISVSWGFRDRDFLLSHGATVIIDHPSELLNINY